MIELFSIPCGTIDLSTYDNVLHGEEVKKFEKNFAEYVGARHACSFNSASSAIFLIFRMILDNWPHLLKTVEVPSTIPPGVPNMILNAGADLHLIDNTDWIGYFYVLADLDTFRVFDSAQAINLQIFAQEASPQDLMVFSFYPTKPVGSIDGGMVVSDDSDKINYLRKMSLNGTGAAINSWERSPEFIGWKMYMNSVQAQIADGQLTHLHEKRHRLDAHREQYDKSFGRSDIPRPDTRGQKEGYHLYRIYVADNQHFLRLARDSGIRCGIHYRSLQHHPLYGKYTIGSPALANSSFEHLHTVSIPFHQDLIYEDVEKVIKFTEDYQDHYGPPNIA